MNTPFRDRKSDSPEFASLPFDKPRTPTSAANRVPRPDIENGNLEGGLVDLGFGACEEEEEEEEETVVVDEFGAPG